MLAFISACALLGIVRQAFDHAKLRALTGIEPKNLGDWLAVIGGFVWRGATHAVGGTLAWVAVAYWLA